jgi:hypothetical protein
MMHGQLGCHTMMHGQRGCCIYVVADGALPCFVVNVGAAYVLWLAAVLLSDFQHAPSPVRKSQLASLSYYIAVWP